MNSNGYFSYTLLGEEQIFQNYFSPKFLRTFFEVREINTDFAKKNNYIYIYIYILKCVIVNFAFKHGSNIFCMENVL